MNALAAFGSIGAFLAASGAVSYATFRPGCNCWGKVHSHGSRKRAAVALTFDDGPTPPFTGQILDILRDAKAPAAFFIVGKNAIQHPDLILRIHAEGHAIGNHTYSHPIYGWLRGAAYWRNQIQRTDDLVQSITGERPRFFRTPMGIKSFLTLRAARQTGHATVAWSCRAYDGLQTDSATILSRLLAARAGDILLLHDGVAPNNYRNDRSPTVAALPALIEGLRRRGFDFVALPELLGV